MNFSQMQERLRLELLRRIQRGTLSVSLLARQTGFRQSHLSNFLHSRRQLSMDGIDRILAAQHLQPGDLLPTTATPDWRPADDNVRVPVVSHATAMHEPYIRRASELSHLWIPAALLDPVRSRPLHQRRATWHRFVAIGVTGGDAQPMDPVIQSEAFALLDRHYNSFAPYHANRPNILAVRKDARLKLRYADFVLSRMILRPHNTAFPVELEDLGPGELPGDLVVGRVILVLNRH